LPHKIFLGVSFVSVPENEASYPTLKEVVGDLVDEIVLYPASSRGGGHFNYPLIPVAQCNMPFNKAVVTREGYLRACCNDYENDLALEDLNSMSLKEAWESGRYQQLRQRHLDDKLDGTLCANCIRGATARPIPLNPTLAPSASEKADRD
jgi:hypothetical protein